MRFVSHLLLTATLILTSCSKQVYDDEAYISPEDSGSGATDIAEAQPAEPVVEVSAGLAAVTPLELQTIFFPYDSDRLTPVARDAITANAKWITDHPKTSVQIEGHCDERGSTQYNLALGERRAIAVKDFLIRLGVERSRLSTLSFGEERPVQSGTGEANWSRNRRAVLNPIQ